MGSFRLVAARSGTGSRHQQFFVLMPRTNHYSYSRSIQASQAFRMAFHDIIIVLQGGGASATYMQIISATCLPGHFAVVPG
eukprot:6189459-Pleurochrysis_carterae.AAC.1